MSRLLSLVLLISFYASGVLSSKCAESDCPLFADGVTEWELTLFPVPSDCTQYIMCQRGDKHYRPCPEGLHFNSVLNVCDWPRDAKCTECVEEIVDTCDEPKTCPAIEDGVTEWELTLLPVPADCTKFIMCQREYRHVMNCPENLHFNPVLNVCDYPEDAGCTGCGTPGTDAPITEAPETEAPETEAPTTEEPETEAPETESPATDEPETEAPETEAPATEAPTTEAPATEEPETCKVSCGDSNSTFNIGNPLDCSRFYICFNNSTISMACPKGLNFCTKEKKCTLPKNANCASCGAEITDAPTTTEATTTTTEATTTTTEATTTTTEATTTTTEATTTTTEATTTTTEATPTEAPVDKCQTPTCPANKSLALLPVPSNCNQFVSCIYGHATVVNCPENLYFNLSYCTIPILSGCRNCKN